MISRLKLAFMLSFYPLFYQSCFFFFFFLPPAVLYFGVQQVMIYYCYYCFLLFTATLFIALSMCVWFRQGSE